MRIYYLDTVLFFFLCVSLSHSGFAQCTNFLSQTPGSLQTIGCDINNQLISGCMSGGNYAVCHVDSGYTYSWTTCGSSIFDTQLTLSTAPSSAGTILAYNDDNCSLQSTISWGATFSGNVYILLSRFYCSGGGSCTPLYWSSSCQNTLIVPYSGGQIMNVCSGEVYDHGGSLSNYSNFANGYLVIQPDTPGALVTLTGNINTEQNYDFIYIYDGVGIVGSPIWQGSGFQNIGILTSGTGPLTVHFTSDYSVTGQGFHFTVICAYPVPVELLSFSAECKSDYIDLDWHVASEHNTSGYNILRTTDGNSTWENIASIKALGDGYDLHYKYKDMNFPNNTGTIYYKLVDVDINGIETESGGTAVNCSEKESFPIITPNPNNGFFDLYLNGAFHGNTTIKIQNTTGKVVVERIFNAETPDSVILFQSDRIQPGTYFISITDSQLEHVLKMIITE